MLQVYYPFGSLDTLAVLIYSCRDNMDVLIISIIMPVYGIRVVFVAYALHKLIGNSLQRSIVERHFVWWKRQRNMEGRLLTKGIERSNLFQRFFYDIWQCNVLDANEFC